MSLAGRSDIDKYILNNREEFQAKLLSEASNVATKIHAILEAGNIDLLKNAETIALYVLGNKRDNLIAFAEVEGISWARHSLTLALKLEWVHAIRRTLWHFLREYNQLNNSSASVEDFYELEQVINDGIDEFLNNFFISYSKFKDELIMNQRMLVEHLTVPIIPVSSSIAVLPLIGMFDSYRMDIIEEKALSEISRLRINALIIDLSGITDMDENTVAHFQKVLIEIKLMGSKSILTGLRPTLAKKMVNLGVDIGENTEIKGNLQQALNEYLAINN
ncbi:anti-anti-sigma factor [Oceanobacillus arenosus]|uniref:Anti-anti-sigma factor n=1 Tax=Oceanobacillus arenosus TaxID=1229153 RepID=A0A3D8PVS8_9BACI|nr:STAS domain-containing protein [Oceanobacillus arenosus]RDW20260.1 anti-anti-sigma factor [Oceanobacillus arenosus]